MFNISAILSDPAQLAMAYKLAGRQQLKNGLVGVLGDRNRLAAIAKKNNDQVSEAIAKRDHLVEAILDYGEELANLDND